MPRVSLTLAARNDILSAMSWYQAHAAEVVPQLTNALDIALKRIAENPQQFPVSAYGTRRALLRKFPYSVIFRETAHEVVVVAVYHMSRNPKSLKRR